MIMQIDIEQQQCLAHLFHVKHQLQGTKPHVQSPAAAVTIQVHECTRMRDHCDVFHMKAETMQQELLLTVI